MRRTLKFLAAASFAALPAIAGAQQVRFFGQTLGCFYFSGGCTPVATSSITGLTYNSGAFDFFTDPVGLSGTSFGAVGASAITDSHGSVQSTAGSFTALPGTLWLRLQTTVFGPTLGSSGNVFTNDFTVFGSTSAPNVGGVHLNPINPLLYAGPFTNGQVLGNPGASASGTVDYWAYDNQSITAGRTVFLSSSLQITSTVTTPEPASMTLMATGLFALVGIGYSRRRNNA
jgi:hypothetical protein